MSSSTAPDASPAASALRDFARGGASLAKRASRSTVGVALKMYHAARDRDTPHWARATIAGALAYFVLPLDAVPDFLPVVGFTDDAAVLAAALGTVIAHIKPAHVQRAEEQLNAWFGPETGAGSDAT